MESSQLVSLHVDVNILLATHASLPQAVPSTCLLTKRHTSYMYRPFLPLKSVVSICTACFSNHWLKQLFLDLAPCSLLTAAVNISETSVNFYETTRRNIPCHLYNRSRENLKSHVNQWWYILYLWVSSDSVNKQRSFPLKALISCYL
jgi:hypothetical protein